MRMNAIFIGDKQNIDKVYNAAIQDELNTLADFYSEVVSKDTLKQHAPAMKSVEVAFSTWGMPALSEDEIEAYLPNLKAVFYAAGSVQYFARPFLHRDVTVVSAYAANAVPVAEYALAQILLANKGFFLCASTCKENRNVAVKHSRFFPGNYDAKVGIIGAGMIGKKVIELLKPFQLDILVFDPYLPDETAERLKVRKTGLIEIFSECHTISNHLANLPATAGILNKEHFDRMLPYATFINTGRGRQVVEEDLINALRAVPTRTAILDVTDPEPVQPDSELLKLDNVILTPHIAGSNDTEVARMAEYVTDDFRRYLQQEPLKYQVSLKMLETMA